MISLDKLTTKGRALYLAYDQGMEHGPSDFDDDSVDPQNILKIAVDGGFNAVIFQRGIAEKYYTGTEFSNKIPLILKLNGKTNLLTGESYSPLLCTVSEAMELGATAVGYTVYVGSEFEEQMLTDFAEVIREAHEHGMPVMGWMYLRGKAIEKRLAGGGKEQDLIAYAARLGLEIGADLVKIKYPGSVEGLRWVVESAGRTKVIVSGGAKLPEEELLEIARISIRAGAIGMAVGRNIWQNNKPLDIASKLKDILFKREFLKDWR